METSIFLANNNRLSPYHKLHEFLELEIFSLSITDILENLKSISILPQRHKLGNKYFAKLDTRGLGLYTSKDIIFPVEFKQSSISKQLFMLLSTKFKSRFIIKIGF